MKLIQTIFSTAIPTADITGLEHINIKSGSELKVTVPIFGKPKPEAFWKYNDNNITGHFSILTKHQCQAYFIYNVKIKYLFSPQFLDFKLILIET